MRCQRCLFTPRAKLLGTRLYHHQMEQNSLLKDLARQREERSCSNSSQKRQRQATGTSDSGGGSSGSSGVASGGVGGGTGGGGTGGGRLASSAVLAPAIVDLCGSDDEATEDPSLALARRLQAEEDLHHSRLRSPGVSGQASSSEPWPGIDDEALAERLQREEMAKVVGPRVILASLGSDEWYKAMTKDENRRRIKCEGPPPPPGGQRTLHSYSSGNEQRLQGGGRVWSRSAPCVVFDDDAVRSCVDTQAIECRSCSVRTGCAYRRPHRLHLGYTPLPGAHGGAGPGPDLRRGGSWGHRCGGQPASPQAPLLLATARQAATQS